ncbi:MAG TPA: glycosyl hydrolase family 18 protein [Chloroflexota bacterium]|nr:glycosyl hydrolase family 18 protein [Chloroflexota bacterium]
MRLYPGPRRRRRARGWLALPLLVVLALIGWAAWLQVSYPTAAPWTSAGYILRGLGRKHARMTAQVVGFMPYWRLDDTPSMRPELLSQVIYFGLTSDGSGHIVQTANGQQEPGWRWWNSSSVRDQIARVHIAGDKFLLGVSMQDPAQISSLLASQSAQQALTAELTRQVATNKLDGLNVDFEVDGKVSDQDRAGFTAFATTLVAAMHGAGASASVDLPALAARTTNGLYDVPALSRIFDQVVVMSYDYYAMTSDVAGPVAPMSGFQEGDYFFDVTTTYADFLKVAPKDKLLMGVPYYGYDWPVQDASQPLAKTLAQNDANGYAELVSYSRAQTDADLTGKNCQWDATADETRCAYTRAGIQRQAWLEEERSIGIKFDFAHAQGLGGVALWTLGYDGSYPQLWNLIGHDFANG